jgi:hypothetical protein
MALLKCPVCQKDKADCEFRPLINVKELSVGNALSEQDSGRDVGGAKLQMVCRNCWQAILDSKEKSEVIEIMETLAGLLLEIDRRRKEDAKRPAFDVIEKYRITAPLNPSNPGPTVYDDAIGITPSYPYAPPVPPWGVQPIGPSWVVGQSGLTVNWTQISHLGDDLDHWTGTLSRT